VHYLDRPCEKAEAAAPPRLKPRRRQYARVDCRYGSREVEGAVAGGDLPEGKWRQLFASYSLHAGLAAVKIATSACASASP
jgi:hypothetical protein